MTQEELNEVLRKHQLWIQDKEGGEKANFRDADLYGANFYEANLSNANFENANLEGANFRDADLYGAILLKANLRRTNFYKANLFGANFRDADLDRANFYEANLRRTNFYKANLYGANFRDADLYGANFYEANLYGVSFDKDEQIRKGIIVAETMTGWKKCQNNILVKLEIPRGAIVFSINNKKCRTNRAIVKEIIGADRAYSKFKYISYYVGDEINIYNFNCQYNVECAEGIHFFRTKEEAEEYEN